MEKMTLGVSHSQKQWYRVGSVAAVVLGISYVIIIPLYARVGAPPNSGEADGILVGDPRCVRLHRLSLSASCVCPIPGAERAQQKFDVARDCIRGAICRPGFGSHMVRLRFGPYPVPKLYYRHG